VSKLFEDLAGNAVSPERWKWLVALCFREWAMRLWIVQEQILNTENVMLHGPRLLSRGGVAIMPTFFGLNWLPEQHVTV
jgi:hypothetical protein